VLPVVIFPPTYDLIWPAYSTLRGHILQYGICPGGTEIVIYTSRGIVGWYRIHQCVSNFLGVEHISVTQVWSKYAVSKHNVLSVVWGLMLKFRGE
jgi:hypothetical protein